MNLDLGSSSGSSSLLLCFALSWDFTLNVFECMTPVGMEIGVAESPALETHSWRGQCEGRETYMLSKAMVIGVLDFVKVVLVELADKGSKVGVFEHAWKNGSGEFIHVLDECEWRAGHGPEERRGAL